MALATAGSQRPTDLFNCQVSPKFCGIYRGELIVKTFAFHFKLAVEASELPSGLQDKWDLKKLKLLNDELKNDIDHGRLPGWHSLLQPIGALALAAASVRTTYNRNNS